MNPSISTTPIQGIWICCGQSIFATGNSPQEAYNRYCTTVYPSIPSDITSCSIYFAEKAFLTC